MNTHTPAPPTADAWRVAGAAVITTFSLGSIHAFSVLGASMEQHFGVERARISIIYSLALATLTLVVLVSPRLYRRWRPDALLAVSFGGCVAGVGVCVFASSLAQVVVGYGLLFGAANGLGYGLSLSMGAAAMPHRKGMVMSVITASYAIGAAVTAPALGVFTRSHGPSGGFVALLVWLLASALLAVMLARSGNARLAQETPADATSASAGRTLLLWFAYGAAVFAGLMAIGHAAGIAAAQGATSTQFATATMLIALGNAGGGFGCALVADRWSVRRLLIGLPLCSLAGLLVLRMFDGVGAAMFGLAVVGVGYGATIAAYPPVIARIVGLGAYPRVYGRVFTAWGVAGLVAAWLAGWLYDTTGSYALALDVAAGMATGSVLVVLVAGRALRA